MDKLKMHSLDGVARNIDLIGDLFPNAVTEVLRDGKVERAIDFDVLAGAVRQHCGGPGGAVSVHLAGQEEGDVGGQRPHYGYAPPGGGGQRGQGRHPRRL